MSRTKKPHVVFYMDRNCIESTDHEVSPRNLALMKNADIEDRKYARSPSRGRDYRLIIYAGRLGEDLRYVETV